MAQVLENTTLNEQQLYQDVKSDSCPSCKRILKKASVHWRWKLTVQVLDAYGWKCACCGETIPEFLTIDHMEGGGNVHRDEVRKEKNDWYKFLVENNFPEGFQTLCYNCNLGRSRAGGVCPHTYEKHDIGRRE